MLAAGAAILALCAGGLAIPPALAAPLDAQEIRGIAIDAEGRPIGNAAVALHRVGGMGGASVDAATTDDRGGFVFRIGAADTAVHFVAIRHGDRLYIGPPVRGGSGPVIDYTLRADPSTELGAVASALAGGAGPGVVTGEPGRGSPRDSGGGTGASWLVALLALTMAVVFVGTAPRYRARRRRELLIELATIENRLAAESAGDEQAELERRRGRLRERLEPGR